MAGGVIRSNVNITVMEFEKQIPRRVLRNANGILPRTPSQEYSAPFALTVKFCLLKTSRSAPQLQHYGRNF